MCKHNRNQKKCKNENQQKTCEHVEAVRSCVKDKEIVLIGGKPSREAAKQIEQALGVRVNWVGTKGTESYRDFRSAVERENVVIVILIILSVRHGHGKVKGLCDKAHKHFVRLQSGHSPNRLAYDIRKQCGKVLGCAL